MQDVKNSYVGYPNLCWHARKGCEVWVGDNRETLVVGLEDAWLFGEVGEGV